FGQRPLLAKQAVTVAHVWSGRLELGLGAGWYEPEHRMYGLDFPPRRELVDRFEESVQVVDSLLRNEFTSFEGRHYRLHDAAFRPAPLQRPRPPLTLGAHRPRMLRILPPHPHTCNSRGTTE